LPPDKLDKAATYIHALKGQDKQERATGLAKTCGILSEEDADAWMKTIEKGCGQVDDSEW